MNAAARVGLDGADRTRLMEAARERPLDILVIGAGATGLGVAVDAAQRGHTVCVVERGDLGAGTSSKSTKLIHGGVRYLKDGQVALVREGLLERGRLFANAAHIVRPIELVATAGTAIELAMLSAGLWIYDALAGRRRVGWSRPRGRAGLRADAPGVDAERFAGGVRFFDGQFDDARMLVALARTALEFCAPVLTRTEAVDLVRGPGGNVAGIVLRDLETDTTFELRAKAIVNATGAWGDTLRRLDRPQSPPLLAPSSGAHIVLPGDFLPGDRGVLVPRTSDGRVLFALPFWGHTLIGTTDVPAPAAPRDPVPSAEEIAFILETAASVLVRAPSRADVLSTWSGLRPLVAGPAASTSKLSRDFAIERAPSGLVTVAGGKWTSYRRMGEAVVRRLERDFKLVPQQDADTRALRLAGSPAAKSPGAGSPAERLTAEQAAANAESRGPFGRNNRFDHYGSDAPAVRALCASAPHLGLAVHPRLELFVRRELARTPMDVLARRSRALLLDADAAIAAAPEVARLIAAERGLDEPWAKTASARFCTRAAAYRA